MNTIQLSIEAGEDQQEILISLLEEHNATGFEQTETHLIAYFPDSNFDSYQIQQILNGYTFSTLTLEEQNWNAVWESNFQPVIVGDFCGIRAEFHDPVPGVAHEIMITPKMSFGTGHHATTYMMIRQMQDLDFKDKKVLDFGTGTGILAILAEKLGAAGIEAIDVDEWSVENSRENSEKNNCSKISISLSSTIPPVLFDIILANINRNVILQYFSTLKQSLPANGSLLVSGLLAADERDIVEEAAKNGLVCIKRLEQNNWISLLFINSKSAQG